MIGATHVDHHFHMDIVLDRGGRVDHWGGVGNLGGGFLSRRSGAFIVNFDEPINSERRIG